MDNLKSTTETNNAIEGVTATRDKRNPPCLIVDAKVLVYTADSIAWLVEAVPQGINPQILLLNVVVKQGRGPMKGVYVPVESFEKCGDDVQQYKQVTISYKEEDTTVDING